MKPKAVRLLKNLGCTYEIFKERWGAKLTIEIEIYFPQGKCYGGTLSEKCNSWEEVIKEFKGIELEDTSEYY